MDLAEYRRFDATGLAQLVAAGEVTSNEVLACARKATELLNPQLNALVELFDEPDHSPEALQNNAPFAGVPFSVKDLVLQREGGLVEMGSRMAAGSRAKSDSFLMDRFRQAGLITLGRTNSPEMGHGPTTEPVLHGACHNPWDITRMAGGSSGGAAAAVAAGIMPIAHANDGAGSIRIPAACCGLVGLKPTRGRVSPGPGAGSPLLGNGIEFAISRTVRDSAALLDCVAGAQPGDACIAPLPPTTYRASIEQAPVRLNIAFTTNAWSGAAIDPEVVAATERAALSLMELGHQVEEARPSLDYELFRSASINAWASFIASSVENLRRETGRSPENHLEAATLAMYRHGLDMSAMDMVAASAAFNTISRQCGRFFERYDVLLSPTTSREAQPLGAFNQNQPGISHEKWFDHKGSFAPFLAVFNCTGQPAISLPMAQSAAGLPLGMHFTGRFGEEHRLLALARQIEEVDLFVREQPTHSIWNKTY